MEKLGIPKTTFYRWYDRYLSGGPEALEDRSPKPSRVWNRIPRPMREKIKDLALKESDLSPRELAVQFTDTEKYFVSEASVYRILKPAETLRWNHWHSKVQTAGPNLQWLIVDCARLAKYDPVVRDQLQKVLARCYDLYGCPADNIGSLANYGRGYRRGLPISTSRAEGCVDDVGNARMGKRRMRWSPYVAHDVAVT